MDLINKILFISVGKMEIILLIQSPSNTVYYYGIHVNHYIIQEEIILTIKYNSKVNLKPQKIKMR